MIDLSNILTEDNKHTFIGESSIQPYYGGDDLFTLSEVLALTNLYTDQDNQYLGKDDQGRSITLRQFLITKLIPHTINKPIVLGIIDSDLPIDMTVGYLAADEEYLILDIKGASINCELLGPRPNLLSKRGLSLIPIYSINKLILEGGYQWVL